MVLFIRGLITSHGIRKLLFNDKPSTQNIIHISNPYKHKHSLMIIIMQVISAGFVNLPSNIKMV